MANEKGKTNVSRWFRSKVTHIFTIVPPSSIFERRKALDKAKPLLIQLSIKELANVERVPEFVWAHIDTFNRPPSASRWGSDCYRSEIEFWGTLYLRGNVEKRIDGIKINGIYNSHLNHGELRSPRWPWLPGWLR